MFCVLLVAALLDDGGDGNDLLGIKSCNGIVLFIIEPFPVIIGFEMASHSPLRHVEHSDNATSRRTMSKQF